MMTRFHGAFWPPCACCRASPPTRQPAQGDLKRLSIEELMRIDVTTTAGASEPVGTTAAAISVITGDESAAPA